MIACISLKMGTKIMFRSYILHVIHFVIALLTFIFRGINKVKKPLALNYYKQTGSTVQQDSKILKKLPSHVGIVIVEDEVYCSDIAKLTLWCIALGISYITIYDQKGLCKSKLEYIQEEFESYKKKLRMDRKYEKYDLKIQSGLPEQSTQVCSSSDGFQIRVLSMNDSRQQLVALTKDVSTAVMKRSMKLHDINPTNVDNLLLERIHYPDLDLVLKFGDTDSLMGLMPWQIRLTEFLSLPSHKNIDYTTFHALLRSYGDTEQRFGK